MTIERTVFCFQWWTDHTHKTEPTRSEYGEGSKQAVYHYPKNNSADLNLLLKQGWRVESDNQEWVQTGPTGVVVLKLYKEVE